MTHVPSQHGNVVGGSLAGRDVNTHFHYHASRRSEVFQDLIDRYRREVEANEEFREFIAELTYYFGPEPASNRPDLAAKLSAGGREASVREATELKEIFWKKLLRNQLSKAAQEIYALLLGMIDHNFTVHVQPLIEAGAPATEVDAVVAREVIDPVWREIEANPLTIMPQDIRGMLYYLTGTCHIRWDSP